VAPSVCLILRRRAFRVISFKCHVFCYLPPWGLKIYSSFWTPCVLVLYILNLFFVWVRMARRTILRPAFSYLAATAAHCRPLHLIKSSHPPVSLTTRTRLSLHSSTRPQLHVVDDQIDRMTATKIGGTAIAKAIRERLNAEIQKKQETNPRYKPCLRILQGELVFILSQLTSE
jgi:hypothetical protein